MVARSPQPGKGVVCCTWASAQQERERYLCAEEYYAGGLVSLMYHAARRSLPVYQGYECLIVICLTILPRS